MSASATQGGHKNCSFYTQCYGDRSKPQKS